MLGHLNVAVEDERVRALRRPRWDLADVTVIHVEYVLAPIGEESCTKVFDVDEYVHITMFYL